MADDSSQAPPEVKGEDRALLHDIINRNTSNETTPRECADPDHKSQDSPSSDSEYVWINENEVPELASGEVINIQTQSYVTWLNPVIHLSLSEGLSYVASFFHGVSAVAQEWTSTTWSDMEERFEKWLEDKGLQLSFELKEETRKRECLVRAIDENFPRIIQFENPFNKEFFIKAQLLTKEEIEYADESQRTRRLLIMVQCRDYRTILFCLWNLESSNKVLVDSILLSYQTQLTKVIEVPKVCTRCLLVERVSMCLVVDSLRSCGEEFNCFVENFSEEKEPAKPSKSRELWKKLFALMTERNMYNDVINDVINAIVRCVEACGYHKDIVRYIKEDQHLVRNSFICICQSGAQGQSNALVSNGQRKGCEKKEKVVERRGHEHNKSIVDELSLQQKEGDRKKTKSFRKKSSKHSNSKTDEDSTESESSHEGTGLRGSKRKLSSADKQTNIAKKNMNMMIDSSEQEKMLKRQHSGDHMNGGQERKVNTNPSDVQMDLLKVGIPEYDSQQDSALPESLNSCASGSNDSGVGGSSETVPKRLVICDQSSSDLDLHETQAQKQNGHELHSVSQSDDEMDINETENELHVDEDIGESDMDTESNMDTNSTSSSFVVDDTFDCQRGDWPTAETSPEPFVNIQIKK